MSVHIYIQSRSARERGSKVLHIINPGTGCAYCSMRIDGQKFDELPKGYRECLCCIKRRGRRGKPRIAPRTRCVDLDGTPKGDCNDG